MALLKKLTGVQTVLAAVIDINYNDTMANLAGTVVTVGVLTSGTNTSFAVWTPPPNAVIIGGRVATLTAWATSSANTLDIGDSDDTDRYTETAAVDLQDVDSPLTGSGSVDLLGNAKIYTGAQNIEFLLTNGTADATAGRTVVTMYYIVLNRMSENIKTF